MLQFIMILCIAAHTLVTRVFCFWIFRKENKPESPERFVMLLPCYNETLGELTRSLDSLIAQKNIDDHPRTIFIVVDGNVKGPGMEKTTQQYLLEDILEPGPSRTFENGYRARDGLFMPTKVQTGFYKGMPYVFVGKRYNQGKRDSLCFARSFIYHYQVRSANVMTMFNNDLFEYIGNAFMQHGLEHIEYLRKRWALGSITNEFVMIFRPGIILVERLQSIVAVLTWFITPFIMAAVVKLILILIERGDELVKDPVFMTLISILACRYFYSLCIGFWLPRNWFERAQYFVGYFFHFITSPFCNVVVLVYSLFNSDDFKWGKTREVIDPEGEKGDGLGGRGTH
ncbi:conserved hypothetical protein [Verticillium alfalfae VaMs.102]|uniref:Chitin synthase n=1 Tax=Verticillium alfalfae (strain VaMs.102 / ATCC MYA-4576 / FGSC 10136) TaxID=526221 RepID=C9SSE0_VERA1|nr:conserved hypothetical protein [Verticillium alfalfae VaMs.102]EEY21705.1 conserved hypothetical protein [Verticillium alfalfae VaMs.102]